MTDHPCKGMTKAQIAAFERIAINLPPCCKAQTTDALLRRGVIIQGPWKALRDEIGPYSVPTFEVPIHIHAQWCEWCSEQPGNNV